MKKYVDSKLVETIIYAQGKRRKCNLKLQTSALVTNLGINYLENKFDVNDDIVINLISIGASLIVIVEGLYFFYDFKKIQKNRFKLMQLEELLKEKDIHVTFSGCSYETVYNNETNYIDTIVKLGDNKSIHIDHEKIIKYCDLDEEKYVDITEEVNKVIKKNKRKEK